MSADNGIYILKSPDPQNPDKFVWRVANAQAIENLDYGDVPEKLKYIGYVFGKSEVYTDEDAAIKVAIEMVKSCYTEYGMNFVEVDFVIP